MCKGGGIFLKFKKKLIAAGLTGMLVVSGLGVSGLASGAGGPGSSEDPLVTKSYVQKLVQQKFEEFMDTRRPGDGDPVGSSPGGSVLQWQVKTLQPGESFIGGSGTEFILRGGTAVIVDPTGSGIPDITSGTNYAAGRQVPANHLFSIPRDDGRGIKAEKEVIVMCRG